MKSSRILLAIAWTILAAARAYSQCYMEKLDAQVSESVDPDLEFLDDRMASESNIIGGLFGVSADVAYFDDSSEPRAFATCKCNVPKCNGTIRLGKRLMENEIYEEHGGMDAAIGVLAHEFAHVMQCHRGWFGKSKSRELHADFMAGFYLAKKSYYSITNIFSFANSLFQKGDYQFWNADHHGTPDERVRAMILGTYYASLTADDAYNIGYKWVTNTMYNYSLVGMWQTPMGIKYRVDQGYAGITFFDFYGNPTIAQQIGVNYYRAGFYNQWGQAYTLDFTIVNENKMVVISSFGTAEVWYRTF